MPGSFIRSATNSAAAVTSIQVVISGVAAGNTLVLGTSTYNSAGNGVPTTVVSSLGGTWVKDVETPFQVGTADKESASIWSLPNAAAGSHTVTVSWSGTSYTSVTVAEISGFVASTPLDRTAQTEGNGTAITVGPTGTTSQNDTFAVALLAATGGVAAMGTTTPSGWTNAGVVQDSTATNAHRFDYRVLTAPEAVSTAWTSSASVFWSTALAVYKTTAAAPLAAGTYTQVISAPGTGSWLVPTGVGAVTVNKIQTWGAGGSGGRGSTSTRLGGAGAGGYSESNNAGSGWAVSSGTPVYYSVGAGGVARTADGIGAAGADTWANIVSNAAPTVVTQGALAKGGAAGPATATTSTGGVGGASASGIGTVKFSGGAGGTASTTNGAAAGGGGAASPTANGATAANVTTAAAGAGAAAGSGGGAGGTSPGGAGGSNANGGGGGAARRTTGGNAGSGGAPGGGGGAAGAAINSGAGGPGQVIITYTVASATGTTYNETDAEPATAGHTQTPALIIPVNDAEPAVASDARSATQVFSSSTSDTSSSTDTVTGSVVGGAVTYNETDTDSAVAGDINSLNQTHAAFDDEAALSGDSRTAVQVFAASRSESAAGSDTVSTTQVFAVSQTDSAISNDASAVNLALSVSDAEPAQATDNNFATNVVSASITDNAVSSDFSESQVQNAAVVYNESLAQTASASDSATVNSVSFAVGTTETAQATDARTTSQVQQAARSESSQGTDVGVVAAVYVVNLANAAAGSDTVSPTQVSQTSLADTATSTDSDTASQSFSINVAEVWYADASVSGLQVHAVSQSDDAQASDTSTASHVQAVAGSDAADSDHDQVAVHSLESSLNDTASGTDTSVASQTQVSAKAETALAGSVQQAAHVQSSSLTQSVLASDTAATAQSYVVAYTDDAQVNDVVSSTYVSVLNGVTYEINELSSAWDTETNTLTQNLSLSQTAQAADIRAAGLVVNASFNQSVTASDTATTDSGADVAATDTATSGDQFTAQVVHAASQNESAVSSSQSVAQATYTLTQIDAVSVNEIASTAYSFALNLSESFAANDNFAVDFVSVYQPITYNESFSETSNATDSAFYGQLIEEQYTDNVVAFDFVYGNTVATPVVIARKLALSAAVYQLLAPHFSAGKLIRASQNGPRPPKPFSTFAVRTTTPTTVVHHEVDAQGSVRLDKVRRSTVEVQFFGKDSSLAAEIMSLKVRMPSMVERGERLGLSVSSSIRVMRVPELLNNSQYEERGVLEFRIYSVLTDNDDVGLIEAVDFYCFDHSHIVYSPNAA